MPDGPDPSAVVADAPATAAPEASADAPGVVLSTAGAPSSPPGPAPDAPAVLDLALAAPLPETDAALPERLASASAPVTAAKPAAPTVLLADDTGIRVLQSGGTAPPPVQSVIIDTISYDPSGDVSLGGRGTGGEFVRVYLDNKPCLLYTSPSPRDS